jgi:hypothetical protein
MEIFESVAWLASGLPTLALLEIYERIARRRRIIPAHKMRVGVRRE